MIILLNRCFLLLVTTHLPLLSLIQGIDVESSRQSAFLPKSDSLGSEAKRTLKLELKFVSPQKLKIVLTNTSRKPEMVFPITRDWYEPEMKDSSGVVRYVFVPSGMDLMRPSRKNMILLKPSKSIAGVFEVPRSRALLGKRFRANIGLILKDHSIAKKFNSNHKQWQVPPEDWVTREK